LLGGVSPPIQLRFLLQCRFENVALEIASIHFVLFDTCSCRFTPLHCGFDNLLGGKKVSIDFYFDFLARELP
jgi:hypothetical protein